MAISVPTSKFSQPLDIANKACYHWGVAKIADFGVANGGTDDAIQALVAADLYESSRRYEMRRNVWTCTVRTAFLRPINTPAGTAATGGIFVPATGFTGLLVPAAWNSTATYLHGSVVSFNGEIYQAKSSVPANYEPDSNPTYWSQFFGTMAVSQWVNGGNVNNPALWNATTTYQNGTSVVGSDFNIYTLLSTSSLNQNPVTDNGVHWQLIGPAQAGSGYFAGELVYIQNGTTMDVYVSLSTGNTDTPGNIPSWTATPQFLIGNSVSYNSVTYQSQIDFNLGNVPVAAWAAGTYTIGQQVLATDGKLYTAKGTVTSNPTGDGHPTDWTDNGLAPWGIQPNTQTDTMTGPNWLQLGTATVAGMQVIYPAGSGPLDQVATRNIFLLPNGFLRAAPQDPKAGSSSYLGAPSGLAYDDWVFSGPYLITREVEPIALRFAADLQDVSSMDPMLAETIALHLALDGNERVTQSGEKEQVIGAKYKQFGQDSRTVNGIEQGATEPPEDDYITCRL